MDLCTGPAYGLCYNPFKVGLRLYRWTSSVGYSQVPNSVTTLCYSATQQWIPGLS